MHRSIFIPDRVCASVCGRSSFELFVLPLFHIHRFFIHLVRILAFRFIFVVSIQFFTHHLSFFLHFFLAICPFAISFLYTFFSCWFISPFWGFIGDILLLIFGRKLCYVYVEEYVPVACHMSGQGW